MTDSMVERVSAAIRLQGDYWLPGETRQEYDIRVACAAIMAMREPGLAIRKLTTFEFAEIEWPRLIDAALSEAQPTGEKPAQGTPA